MQNVALQEVVPTPMPPAPARRPRAPKDALAGLPDAQEDHSRKKQSCGVGLPRAPCPSPCPTGGHAQPDLTVTVDSSERIFHPS